MRQREEGGREKPLFLIGEQIKPSRLNAGIFSLYLFIYVTGSAHTVIFYMILNTHETCNKTKLLAPLVAILRWRP